MRPRLNQRIQFSLAYVLVAAMVLLLLQSWLAAPRTVEIPMSKFLELVRADTIEKVARTEREIRGIAQPDALPNPPSGPGDRLRQCRQGRERRKESNHGQSRPCSPANRTVLPHFDPRTRNSQRRWPALARDVLVLSFTGAVRANF